MSSIITSENGLVSQPYDKYWDAPLTRREAQRAVDHLAENDTVLNMRADTSHIVINLICEKLNITKAEIETYVARKKAEMAMVQTARQAQEPEGTANGPNQ